MHSRIRLLLVVYVGLCALAAGAGVALADDCGSPDDCQTAPGNIEGALGVVGLGAGVAILNNALNGGSAGGDVGGSGATGPGDGSFLDDVAGGAGGGEEAAGAATDDDAASAEMTPAETADGVEPEGAVAEDAGAEGADAVEAEDAETDEAAASEEGEKEGADDEADDEGAEIPRFRGGGPLGEGGGE
jgi:hypothetical protein